jgi:hypothetical protein
VDERFRGKGIWVGLGALAIVFLCVMMCGMVASLAGPRSAVYVQPPVAEQSGAVPPPAIYGYGPGGISRTGAVGPFGFVLGAIGALFKLAFLGLLLLLGLGLVRRVFWGHHCWGPPPGWRPPMPPQGGNAASAPWGPWGWHRHRRTWGPPPWWGPEPEPGDKEDEPEEQYGVEE